MKHVIQVLRRRKDEINQSIDCAKERIQAYEIDLAEEKAHLEALEEQNEELNRALENKNLWTEPWT